MHTLGDAHLYLNHLDQAKLQLTRAPFPFPTVRLAARGDIFAFEEGDVTLVDYRAHRSIKLRRSRSDAKPGGYRHPGRGSYLRGFAAAIGIRSKRIPLRPQDRFPE